MNTVANPFESIESRLASIESKLDALKHHPKPSQQEPQDQPLDVQQAANFLNLRVPTIYTKVSKGELSYVKRNGRLYFFRTDLIEYLMQGRKPSNDEIEANAHTNLKPKK